MPVDDTDHSAPVIASTLDDAVAAVIRPRAPRAHARVVPLLVGNRRMWLKQPERHTSLRKRLTKGDGVAALRRETANLRNLARQGIPVPEVLASADDHLVIADSGPTLSDSIEAAHYTPDMGIPAFAEAGRALAALHSAGIALGRGKPKDFCWDGQHIRFIDFERSPRVFDPATTGRRNLVNFVLDTHFTGYRTGRDVHAEACAFLHGYVAAGGAEGRRTLEAARRWARRRWWLAALSLPIALMRPLRRSPDIKAIAPSLILLAWYVPEAGPEPQASDDRTDSAP